MTKLNKILFTDNPICEKLLTDIVSICEQNPDNEMSAPIKSMIESASIPMQMDKDLIRRLTDPSCNPLDINFDFPISALTKQYATA